MPGNHNYNGLENINISFIFAVGHGPECGVFMFRKYLKCLCVFRAQQTPHVPELWTNKCDSLEGSLVAPQTLEYFRNACQFPNYFGFTSKAITLKVTCSWIPTHTHTQSPREHRSANGKCFPQSPTPDPVAKTFLEWFACLPQKIRSEPIQNRVGPKNRAQSNRNHLAELIRGNQFNTICMNTQILKPRDSNCELRIENCELHEGGYVCQLIATNGVKIVMQHNAKLLQFSRGPEVVERRDGRTTAELLSDWMNGSNDWLTDGQSLFVLHRWMGAWFLKW